MRARTHGRSRFRRIAAAAAFAAAAGAATATVPPTPLSAQKSLVFEDFRSEIRVLPDGDIEVTETLRPRFTGQWNGILRNLRLTPPANYDADYLYEVELLSATDEAGRPLRHDVNRLDRSTRQFQVWVPDARDRTATVVLTYRVRHALGFFRPDSADSWEPMDELYWQVTGTEWEVPILRASARVELPPGAGAVQAAAYVGRGSDRAPVVMEAGAVEVPPVGRLDPGEGLTLGVGWPAGFVVAPDPDARAVAAARPGAPPEPAGPLAAWPLLIPLLIGWWMYRVWSRRGRDPAERAITVRWEPPADMAPAEAGTLVDHSAGMHDLISTLVDLAVRGYIVIEEREKAGFLAFGKDYTFYLMRPREEWGELKLHERRFLSGLFDTSTKAERVKAVGGSIPGLGGLLDALGATPSDAPPREGAVDSVRLSDLKDQFYKRIPDIKESIYTQLVDRGHYLERPDKVRGLYVTMGVFAAFFGFLGLPLADAGHGVTGGTMVAAGVISGAIIAVFGALMPARTEKGARTREALLGFERFLEKVESPQYRRMITSPDQFERYLPYAMAFQCEDRWAAAFDDLLTEPPDWYHAHHGGVFRASTFTSGLAEMSTATTTTLSSSPGSSGSGGGGSVGGGGGGGGGGGF